MVDSKYSIAYSEVLEILKYISIEDYNKIPKNKIDLFKANSNNNYTFNYDPNKTLDEQNVSKIAKCIIAILFRDYWATEIQKEKIIAKQNYDRQRLEEEKKEKYSPNNLFNNNSANNYDKAKQEQALVIKKDEIWYKKIYLFLKKLLKK